MDFSEWFKSELKEESLFQAHKPCWKLYSHDSALQQLKTYQVFRERNIFRQQKERSLWDQILNVNLWKLKKRGRSNIVFDNHLIFFFHKTYTIGFRNLHICKPESSYLSSLREIGKKTKELYPWLKKFFGRKPAFQGRTCLNAVFPFCVRPVFSKRQDASYFLSMNSNLVNIFYSRLFELFNDDILF